jgi:filamentous hemagglutinin family protein
MNHVYRLKRSGRTQQLQAVPENARSASKGSVSTGKTLAQTVGGALASFALSGLAGMAYAQQAPPATPPAANQLPQGGVVTRGSANIHTSTTPTGNAQLTVNQSSNRAVIDWASFNVGSQAKVQFKQPSSSAVVLNNILGHNASQIYGQISANGQVFLSNPNGVYFSPTAQVNVGALVATTGKANADEFMAGKTTFNRGASTGSVVNQGQLTSAAGGYIALLAPEVRNQGVVIAQAGTVALASGEAITLNFNNAGTGLAGITTTAQAIAALVENRSAVLAEGGQIILSAHALASLQGAVVKNSGQLSATSLSTQGGKIVLMGDSIELTGTSQIQASGVTGGGTVLVGGDWQGTGDMRQATQVTMAQGASIEANATGQGNGGKVVLWSDVYKAGGLTQVDGRIEAKGAGTGNGGQVETSGYSLLVGEQIQVNTGGGEWLLDPSDITISSGSTADITYAVVTTTGTYTPTSGVASSIVNASTLVSNLGSNNVNITTINATTPGAGTGNITVASDLSWSSAYALTLTAAGGISGSGNISMAGAAGTGLVFNQTGNSTYSGNITGSNAKFTKQGAGTLTLTGSNTYAGLTTVSAGTLKAGVNNAFGTGNITVDNIGALDLNGKTLTNPGTFLTGNGALINNDAADVTYDGDVTYNVATNNSVKISATAGKINLNTISGSGSGNLNLEGVGGVVNGTIAAQSNVNIDSSSSWTFNGANSIKRPSVSTTVFVNSGILKLGNASALGSVSLSTAPAFVEVKDGAAIDLNGFDLNPSTSLNLSGAGVITGPSTTSGALFNSGNGASSIGSFLFLGSNSLIVADNGAINLTRTGFSATGKTSSSSTYSELTLAGSTGGLIAGGLNFTGLIKQGAGTWTLTGNNNVPVSANISTSIIGGTLQIGNGGTTGQVITGTAISVSSGATLAYNRSSGATLTNTITGTGTIANLAYGSILNLSGANVTGFTGTYSTAFNLAVTPQTMASIVLPSAPDLAGRTLSVNTFGSAASFSDKQAITWTGTATGTPTLKLNGAVVSSSSSGFGEYLTLNASNLTIRYSSALWSLTNNGSTTYYSTTTDATDTALVGSAIINVRTGYSVVESGVLSGTGSLTVSGGTLTLAGLNTYSGGTTVSAGTLKAGTITAFGSGAVSVTSGAALDLAGQTMTSTGALTLNGTGVSSGGALMNSGGAATYAGLITLGSATSIVGGSGTIALTHTGSITGATYNLTLGGAAGGSFAGAIGTTSGNVTKQDAGTWVLSGSNTFSGGTFINGGTLQISSDANLGAASSAITINGGTLAIAGQANALNLQSTRSITMGATGGTISNNGGYALTVNGAITSTGSVTLNGGDITFGNIAVSTAAPILVKSTGTLTQKASTSVTSAGGSITYWADSDGNGDGAIAITAGTLGAATQINANSGNIVLGGGNGATAADGQAVGAIGVQLGNFASLSGANITVVGKGGATAAGMGVSIGSSATVSATGSVSITGTGGSASGTSNNRGVDIGASTIESTGSGSVTITGTGGGSASGVGNYGVVMTGTSVSRYAAVRTNSGALTIVATSGFGVPSASAGFVPFSFVQLGSSSQTGPLTVQASNMLTSRSSSANSFQTTGAITLEPLVGNTSFTSNLGVPFIAAGASSVTIGRSGNTAGSETGHALSVQGPVNIYGNTTLFANLTATGQVSVSGALSIGVSTVLLKAPSLLVTGTGASNAVMNTDIGTFAGSGLGMVYLVNQGPLTIGTVGGTSGISSSRYMDISTLTGDLTVSSNLATTSNWGVGAAIVLNAGQSKSALDPSGGNVVVTGTPTITVGAGGNAIAYTGSVAGSTALATLAGAGSGRFRYGSDETTKNYTSYLGTGLFAIYREQPTVSWSSGSDQSIVYGQSPTTSNLTGEFDDLQHHGQLFNRFAKR